MKLVVSVVAYGSGKAYVFDKFMEMASACIDSQADMDISWYWAVDRDTKEVADFVTKRLPHARSHSVVSMRQGHVYVEDMLMEGRNYARLMAQSLGAKLLYQGVDCLWQSAEDFRHTANLDVPVVSALTSARDRPDYAVARRFDYEQEGVFEEGGIGWTGPVMYFETQHDIPAWELAGGGLVPSGFPGADAIFFDKDTLSVGWEHHVPWYRRVQSGSANIDCMEYTCLELLRRGKQCYVDADTRVWHVHEDGWAHMWPDVRTRLEDLHWHGS